MGTMIGYRQVSLYVDPDLYKRAGHVADLLDEPMYTFVNKALTLAIEQRTTLEQRKALDVFVGPPPVPEKKTSKKEAPKKESTKKKPRKR